MRKTFKLIAAMLVLSLILVGCGSGGNNQTPGQQNGENADSGTGSAETVKWIVNSSYPDTNHIGETLLAFSEKVKEKTDGKVEIEVMANGALGYAGPELLKVVRDNMVPMSDIMLSMVAGDEPLFGISTLPFLYRDYEGYKLLNDIARPYFDQVVEEKWNQKLLYLAPWPISGFWTQNELNTIEDVKGLKMRTFDEMGALVVEAVGGTPYPLPFGEVYSALATGVIDSVLTSTPTAVDAKFWEVLKYYSPVNVFAGINGVTVNLDEFNKLDAETQEAIIEAAREVEKEIWAKVQELDKEMEAIANENGIVTVEPSEELMQKLEELTEHIRQDWLDRAPAEAREIIEKYYEEVGR